MTQTASQVRAALLKLRNRQKAAFFPSFFKTGKGQYGEGDVFLGITVPQTRSAVKQFRDLPLPEVERLLADRYHEVRLCGLLILVAQFEKGSAAERAVIIRFYLAHLAAVNNWDLVDATAPQILGTHLLNERKDGLLTRMARSTSLWEQRIAIVSTYAFIRKGKTQNTIRLSVMLLDHPHDLMHKAVGWMLREVGKKDTSVLRTFLEKHAATMPRTMLRYAIEKFSEAERRHYLGRAAVARAAVPACSESPAAYARAPTRDAAPTRLR